MHNYNVFLQNFFENNFLYKNTLNSATNNVFFLQKSYLMDSMDFILRIHIICDELFNINFMKQKLNTNTIINFYVENNFFKKNYINMYLFILVKIFKFLLFTVFVSTFYILYFYKIEKKKYFKNLILKEIDQEFSNLEDFIL